MKKIILLLNFLLMTKAYSYEAIVIVLEAPLLKEAKLGSTVLQVLRKGSKVYVPNEIGNQNELPEFVQTYDRVGDIAFIPSKYIKMITHDLSENKTSITYPVNDPTDYRLEEPIPETYPFDNSPYLRASLSYSMGNNTKTTADYDASFADQNFSSEIGARFSLTRKISFDKYDRYYFGLISFISSANNKILFKNNNSVTENHLVFRLGPSISYDAYKNNDYRLTIGTGFTYNYHLTNLKVDALETSEEISFNGYSLSPLANIYLQALDVFPKTDLLLGSDLSFYLPHSQISKTASGQISSGLKSQVSFFLGLQAKY
ncbi:MAG: hypothetical protein Q7U04_13885 [Bacteriovorax sp.]|nr:hypothetical protein [Bacteriovorax sp.]